MTEAHEPIDPHEIFTIPKRRRFMHEYRPSDSGDQELHIYFGLKEITFDGVEEMAFGERLIEHDNFMAASAMNWSKGAPYSWEQVQEWLEALLYEGIIERENRSERPLDESPVFQKFMEHEANRKAPTKPAWWYPDPAPVLDSLVGRTLELGFLEAVVPVHRIAHPAVDTDGRQVGEANVFPEKLRMRIPTDWKKCSFAGSRYQDDRPMNVTALKTMIRHWPSMLQGILEVREEFLRRYPLGPEGWKLGDIYQAACSVLAWPSYLLLRGEDRVENGDLSPILSSIYRVIDGVRMVSIYLLDLPEEPMKYDTLMTGERLHHLTDRDNHFISKWGVCAGPVHMVDELFQTLLTGKPVEGKPEIPTEWTQAIPAAVDYGLMGNQIYSVTSALYVRMGLAYDRIRTALLEDSRADPEKGFFAEVERDWEIILPGRLHWNVQRDWAHAHYRTLFERSQVGVRGHDDRHLVTLDEILTPPEDQRFETGRSDFVRVVQHALGSQLDGATAQIVGEATYDYLRTERAALRGVDTIQRRVNELLKRDHPERKLTGDDLAISHQLRKGTPGGMPYLMDLLKSLGIVVENNELATRVSFGGTTIELS